MMRGTKIKAEERFPITGQGLLQENYWMAQNVKVC